MRCKACDSYIQVGDLCDWCIDMTKAAEEDVHMEQFVYVKETNQLDDSDEE